MSVELYIQGSRLTPQQYVTLEKHQMNLEVYISAYGTSAGETKTINGKKTHHYKKEIGSDSKKSGEKYEALKRYNNRLKTFLHKQSELVFPLLSDRYNGETI